MATGNLEFGKRLSLKGFASTNGISSINIVKNPNTDKLFWAADGWSGPIFGDFHNAVAFLQCTDTQSGETFWALTDKEAPSENVVFTISF